MQVHLLMCAAQTAETEDQLGIHRRLKGHRRHEKSGVPLQHGVIIAPPCHQLYILSAPRDEIAKYIGKRLAVRQLFFRDARDLLDVLIQLLIHTRANQPAEPVQHVSLPTHAAGADFNNLMRYAMVCMKTALIPFQIKHDYIFNFFV